MNPRLHDTDALSLDDLCKLAALDDNDAAAALLDGSAPFAASRAAPLAASHAASDAELGGYARHHSSEPSDRADHPSTGSGRGRGVTGGDGSAASAAIAYSDACLARELDAIRQFRRAVQSLESSVHVVRGHLAQLQAAVSQSVQLLQVWSGMIARAGHVHSTLVSDPEWHGGVADLQFLEQLEQARQAEMERAAIEARAAAEARARQLQEEQERQQREQAQREASIAAAQRKQAGMARLLGRGGGGSSSSSSSSIVGRGGGSIAGRGGSGIASRSVAAGSGGSVPRGGSSSVAGRSGFAARTLNTRRT